MSAERECFSRRELRSSLGTRNSRRAGTKALQTRRSRDGTTEKYYRPSPATRIKAKLREIRRTCECPVHQAMRAQ